jgi:hypothetical protein
MDDKLRFGPLSHLNLLSEGYERTKSRLIELFDVQVNLEIPAAPDDDTDAFLFTLGGVITEAFVPRQRAERGQGRLLNLYGEHYLGVEYCVADVAESRRVCERHGVRLIRDDGPLLFTYPGACCGLAWELFEGDFHHPPAGGTEGEEGIPAYFTALKPDAWWRDEHPLGVTGLARITTVVRDLDASVEQFTGLVDCEIVGHPARTGASAVELLVTGTIYELLAPTADGPLAGFAERYGDRMRSAVYRVADLGRVEKHLAGLGVTLEPGYTAGTFLVPPAQALNLHFEFSES